MAILTVALVRVAGRSPVRWLGAFAAALIAVASHLLLDLTNVYGIRLLLPFSGRWFHLDWTSVIDLCIWAVFLLCVAGPFLARLVGSEITSGAGRERHHGRGFAIFALIFLLAYNYGRSVLHARALSVMDSRIYQEMTATRVVAGPDAVNPLRWRGLVETRDFWAAADLRLWDEFDPVRATIFHKPEPDPAIPPAAATPEFREFLAFSQDPLWRVVPVAEPENARRVEVIDLRFGTPSEPGLMVSALVSARLEVLESAMRWGTVRPR
jgi:inner membrane protein